MYVMNWKIYVDELENFTFDIVKVLRYKPIYRKIPKGNTLYVGDIHGYYDNVKSALKLTKKLSLKNIVFLGDYGDRGPEQLRTIINVIYAFARSEGLTKTYEFIDPEFNNLKCNVIALQGNHENIELSLRYGLVEELVNNYYQLWKDNLIDKGLSTLKFKGINVTYQSFGTKIDYILNLLNILFSHLPFISQSATGSVGIHGGIPSFDNSLECGVIIETIKMINTPFNFLQNSYANQPSIKSEIIRKIKELVWNDEDLEDKVEIPHFSPSFRGDLAHTFNRTALEVFLKNANAKRLIRSHEATLGSTGHFWDDQLIHVFSAYPYMGHIKRLAYYYEDSSGNGEFVDKLGNFVK